jgi:hypothetical protein
VNAPVFLSSVSIASLAGPTSAKRSILGIPFSQHPLHSQHELEQEPLEVQEASNMNHVNTTKMDIFMFILFINKKEDIVFFLIAKKPDQRLPSLNV